MTKIYSDLYQFTYVLEPMKLSMHQYLLLAEEPILIQTGAVPQTQITLPRLKELLGGKPLKYVLISHFESDECGGLALVLEQYPKAAAVCSETTARQIWDFGIARNVQIVKPGETFGGSDFEFEVIAYPSETHLWEGVLFAENRRGIFFSSDLMFQMGETHGQVTESDWESAIAASGAEQLPNIEMQDKLRRDLRSISPNFVASGHGACIKIINST
ncbi:MAG: MBL fold metallo-hydrolase [Synergistaceae bacterium]|jgi:flavorubredoxin|nr:MBL fold metallo-hydrolase [Synergistaceae bacterium]